MLKNIELANKEVATEFGKVSFNAKGECNGLTAEQEKKLGELKGFDYIAEKAAPKPAVKDEPKEAPKAAAKPRARKAKAEEE